MQTETKVGLFVVIGLISLFLLSTRVQTVANLGKEGYTLYAFVPSAVGLEENSLVRINGVEAGFVKNIKSKRGRVELTLFIYDGQEISADSQMIIAQESLLGGNFINIIYGESDQLLTDQQEIKNYKVRATIDEAVDEIRTFVANLNDTFDKETRANLQDAIAEFKQVALEFKQTGITLNERLPQIMKQIDDLTAEFRQTGKDINARLPAILEKFANIEDGIQEIIDENKKPLNSALTSVDGFFKKGSDTLDSINKIVQKADTAEMQIDLAYNKMLNDGYGEGKFGIAYLPNPTNYYMIDVTTSPKLNKTDPATGKPAKYELHDEGRYLISAQAGKRYSNWLLRGGLIQSTGGVGVDYFSKSDRLKLSLEAFDFNAENDIRGKNAHLRATARWLPFKSVALYAGYDNFINAEAANIFVGAGVHFVDDDLKYIIINAAPAAAK